MDLVLASSSISRLNLLASVNIYPKIVDPANIDETPKHKELPHQLALRLAIAKANAISNKYTDGLILGADTVTACGRKILPKALSDEDVMICMKLLSGRRHKVYTGVSINKLQDKKIIRTSSRLVTSVVQFKRLDHEEMLAYIQSKQGINKSGACNIDGMAGVFVSFIRGSYSNIIGLPLHETYMMLKGLGFKKEENNGRSFTV